MANIRYNSDKAKSASELHNAVKRHYHKKQFLTPQGTPDNHKTRMRYREVADGSIADDYSTTWYLPNTTSHDLGMRNQQELDKAMERFKGKKEHQKLQEAQKGSKDWKNHKYTAKVVGKNGKVRYIYDNPNNGGRTMFNFFQQPKSGKTNLKQSNNSAKVQSPKKSGSNIISDGMKAVGGLLDGVKNLPIAKLFG